MHFFKISLQKIYQLSTEVLAVAAVGVIPVMQGLGEVSQDIPNESGILSPGIELPQEVEFRWLRI